MGNIVMQFSSDMPMIGVSFFYCLKSRKRLFAGKQGEEAYEQDH